MSLLGPDFRGYNIHKNSKQRLFGLWICPHFRESWVGGRFTSAYLASIWDTSNVVVSTAASLEGSITEVRSKKWPNLLLKDDCRKEWMIHTMSCNLREQRRTLTWTCGRFWYLQAICNWSSAAWPGAVSLPNGTVPECDIAPSSPTAEGKSYDKIIICNYLGLLLQV